MYPSGCHTRQVTTLTGITREKFSLREHLGKRVGGGVATERVGINVPIAGDGRPSWGAWSEPPPERDAAIGYQTPPTGAQSGENKMAQIDIEILTPFAAKFMEGTTLTPAERAEVLRIAQGFACKDSAAAAGVSPETIRARRKRTYRKLDVPGSGELLASLLSLSLKMLAKGERIEPRPVAPTQPTQGASSAVIAR